MKLSLFTFNQLKTKPVTMAFNLTVASPRGCGMSYYHMMTYSNLAKYLNKKISI